MDGEPVSTDRQGLEVLDLETCMELAGSVPVGRVAFFTSGEVLVLPVNHVLDQGGVAFRVAPGSKLDAAIMNRSMSFEADAYDEEGHDGWSVLVTGRARYVDDEDVIARLEQHELVPWSAPDVRDSWVLLRPDRVTGRRIV